MEWLKTFNNDYANAVMALTPIIIGVVSWGYYRVYRESKTKQSAAIMIKPSFVSLKNELRIDTVKRFKFTDDSKNYQAIETLYTPQSWKEYIRIDRRFLRTQVISTKPQEMLLVTIKRHPYENWKMIAFNR